MHPRVAGVSVAMLNAAGRKGVSTVSAGWAIKGERKMAEETWVQHASLSKTVGTAFALETFAKRGMRPTDSVNGALRKLGSPWVLKGKVLALDSAADAVQLQQLVNHTALGMHYVPGVNKAAPPPLDLLSGKCAGEGYAALFVEREPGTVMNYSGGGFIVLQYLMELIHKRPIHEAIRDFTARCGAVDMAFDHATFQKVGEYAQGYYDDGALVPGRGGLVFPALAAGGRGTTAALANFLMTLAQAYQGGTAAISKKVARQMLDDSALIDLGAFDFMHAKCGLGVFVARAGPNRIMLHQAANDGFRGVYVVCFDGPDAADGPVGFVCVANGDNAAMFCNCDIALELLKHMNLEGVNLSMPRNHFKSADDLLKEPQEQIVNLGYKELVFKSFVQPKPGDDIIEEPPSEPTGRTIDTTSVFDKCINCFTGGASSS